jgi:phosphotransferase system HPr-like phosphotransfer protein
MLAASPGCQIEIRASGREAEKAADALAALVNAGFDES